MSSQMRCSTRSAFHLAERVELTRAWRLRAAFPATATISRAPSATTLLSHRSDLGTRTRQLCFAGHLLTIRRTRRLPCFTLSPPMVLTTSVATRPRSIGAGCTSLRWQGSTCGMRLGALLRACRPLLARRARCSALMATASGSAAQPALARLQQRIQRNGTRKGAHK